MTRRIVVESSARIDAPPTTVYEILADYRVGHPSILPAGRFVDYEVLEGGRGAGTRIRFAVVQWGGRRDFQMTVTEPEPGRRLRETDERIDAATDFVVESCDDGRACRVTLRTEWTTAGLAGWAESWLAPRMLRPLYAEELRNLASAAAARTT